ncbi:ATP-binding protein [Variovorax sp. GT1P44]|uniref:hybrid sensor histidine kinase/response regulator n=1 Tax=Variovorax sp. GT1P44 TaxID=3443742 RepID=UPI003F454576
MVTLQRRLLLLTSLAILPLALVLGFALLTLLGQQRAQIEQSTLSLARALVASVDSELKQTVSALQALALVEQLADADAGENPSAYALAKAFRVSRPEWRGIVLARPSGEVVFETESPFAAANWTVMEPSSVAEVVRNRAAAVGPLVQGPNGNWGFTVRVPVFRQDELVYVLAAIVDPGAIGRVLDRQRVPQGWVTSVFDSNNRRIARSRDPAKNLGSAPSASLQALLAQGSGRNEVVGTTLTLEGDKVHTAVVRIPLAGWTLALGAPTAVAETAMWRSAIAFGGGLFLSLCLGGMAAWRVSRSIVQPVAQLRDNAATFGKGGPFSPIKAGFVEIEAASDALVEAAELRSAAEAERERLLVAEQAARSIAEEAQQRLQRLVSASALLSRSLEEDAILGAMAAVVVPDIADICRIDLLDGDGQLQRKMTKHADPARAEAIAQLVSTGKVSATTPGSFPWVMASGQTYLRNFDSTEHDDIVDPTFRAFARTVGMRAVCVIPLVARGRTIGAMAALHTESGRRFTAEDGALIGELAQRAALALDNGRLYSECKAALELAEVANRTKDEFLAMLGHELRNPLAPMVTALELMKRRDDTVFPRERQIIGRQVKHLARMVDDLLDISRITSGKVKLNAETVDVQEIVTRALELTMPLLETRASLPLVVAPNSPILVRGDSTRLTQIVCNLLNNAAKFTAKDKPIRIQWQRTRTDVCLTVADEGIGIPAALLPRIFDRFVQGEQPLQRDSGGLGLGLAIARSLVELHGGHIRAASGGPGLGSVFELTLPAMAREGLGEGDAGRVSADAPVRPPGRLLVVDDNADAAEVLALMLQLEGHEVRTAGNAPEALALLETYEPEAAILDIGLPGMNGYELAQALRARPKTEGMLLIALTGYGQESDRIRALAAGFDLHMAKPAQIEALRVALNHVVRARA